MTERQEPETPDSETTAAPSGRRAGRQTKLAMGVVVVCALLALFWPRGEGSFEAPGGFLVDEGGRPSPLGSHLAPVTVLHFWATWCPPCLTEIPALLRLRDELASDPNINVILVAVADSVDKVDAFMEPGEGEVLYDPRWEVAHRYGTYKLPETYLVARGSVLKKFEGATEWDAPEIREELRQAAGRYLTDD